MRQLDAITSWGNLTPHGGSTSSPGGLVWGWCYVAGWVAIPMSVAVMSFRLERIHATDSSVSARPVGESVGLDQVASGSGKHP